MFEQNNKRVHLEDIIPYKPTEVHCRNQYASTHIAFVIGLRQLIPPTP